MIMCSWVDHPRFRRARFDLGGGRVVFIDADDVRRGMAAHFQTPRRYRTFWTAIIEPDRGLLNCVTVCISDE